MTKVKFHYEKSKPRPLSKDFLQITDFSAGEITRSLELAREIKKKKIDPQPLKNKSVACIFHKPSLRTRVSFETGIIQMGGYPVYITEKEIELGVRESIADAAKVLSRYVALILIRTFEHSDIEQLARFASVPVINALTNLSHPCQVMGDLFTIWEHKKRIKPLSIAYLGDGNNICNSWLEMATRLPLDLRIGTSRETRPDEAILQQARKAGLSQITITLDPVAAVSNSDVIYTDVWASMGQKHLAEQKAQLLSRFQVNSQLLAHAKPDALVMHCLPANRGQEITDEVLDGKHSIVFDQAENRLHIQKAIMLQLLSVRVV